MIKVFIVDDHVLVREGLNKILLLESDFTIVGESDCAYQALELLGTASCDVLVLDIALPDKSGLEILKEVKVRYPKMRVLMLSIYPEERYALRALKNGADGYLTKNSAAEDLIAALRTIMSGKKYISPLVAQELADHLNQQSDRPAHTALSDREFQIMLLLGSGKTVTQVAQELHLSVSTVNTHRTHLLGKMKLKTNCEIVRYVIENHLVE
jgi:DNA-binding NarL/FixJ family response regulator